MQVEWHGGDRHRPMGRNFKLGWLHNSILSPKVRKIHYIFYTLIANVGTNKATSATLLPMGLWQQLRDDGQQSARWGQGHNAVVGTHESIPSINLGLGEKGLAVFQQTFSLASTWFWSRMYSVKACWGVASWHPSSPLSRLLWNHKRCRIDFSRDGIIKEQWPQT